MDPVDQCMHDAKMHADGRHFDTCFKKFAEMYEQGVNCKYTSLNH